MPFESGITTSKVPEDGDDGAKSSAMEVVDSLDNHFLNAKTKAFPDQSHPSDQDWDRFVVSAAQYTSSVAGLQTYRPTVGTQIVDIYAILFKIFGDSKKYTKFLSHRDEAAQDLLDLLQKFLDHGDDLLEPRLRAILYVALVRLSRKSELYPRTFSLTDVDVAVNDLPLAHGRFAGVYRGTHNKQGVCVKLVQRSQSQDPVFLHKTFAREAVVWGQLRHPNILPFLGIYLLPVDEGPLKRLCLISPWMSNGNVREFLDKSPQHDRTSLIFEAASGMKYLHENGVVHGDLKCLNILVTQYKQACLADFGQSFVTDSKGLRDLSSANISGGTAGFQAPELSDISDTQNEMTVRRTQASDVFAFGMTCYEMFAGKPFGRLPTNTAVVKISRGERPGWPTDPVHSKYLTKDMWDLIQDCWKQVPSQRPTAAQITTHLQTNVISNGCQNDWGEIIRRPGFKSAPDGRDDPTIIAALSHLQSLFN